MNAGDPHCQPGSPNLALNKVDVALCTAPAHESIPDPIGYFTRCAPSIQLPEQPVHRQFPSRTDPGGPPLDERVPEDRVMDAMEPCGFTDIGSYSKKLPYRYMVQAQMFAGEPVKWKR